MMRIKFFFIGIVLLFISCRLGNKNELQVNIGGELEGKVTNLLTKKEIRLGHADLNLLAECINKAEYVGIYKWMSKCELDIILSESNERLTFNFNGDMFKIKGKGDYTYKFNQCSGIKNIFDICPSEL